jgi:hypothetical protein
VISHSAIMEQSTPACSSSIAARCLSTCGDTFLAFKGGQLLWRYAPSEG